MTFDSLAIPRSGLFSCSPGSGSDFDLDWKIGLHKKNEHIISKLKGKIARGYTGVLNEKMDVAFAEVSNAVANEYTTRFTNPPMGMPVTRDDVFVTEVSFSGSMTTNGRGIVVHDNWAQSFDYTLENGRFFQNHFDDLIAISQIDDNGRQTCISMPKDSGSVLFDNNGNARGIVVANDGKHTYAIKMTTVLSRLGLTLQLT